MAANVEYKFATEADVDQILSLVMKNLIVEDPLLKTLNLPPESRRYFEYIVGKCVHTPYSFLVLDKATKEIVGFRMIAIANRDQNFDYKPFQLKPENLPPAAKQLYDIHEFGRVNMWKKIDTYVTKILIQHLIYVKPEYKAVMKEVENYELNPTQLLNNDGMQGLVGEAASNELKESQKGGLWAKIYEWPTGITHADGSTTCAINFQDFRKARRGVC